MLLSIYIFVSAEFMIDEDAFIYVYKSSIVLFSPSMPIYKSTSLFGLKDITALKGPSAELES